MLIVLIGRLFTTGAISLIELTAITAFYIGYRRFSNVFVSPIAGRIADKFGIERVFLVATFFTVISLVAIIIGFVEVGLIVTFTLQSISSALAPGGAALNQENRLKAIAANTTWKDLGSASGALIGGALLKTNSIHPYFLSLTIVLLGASITHVFIRNPLKQFIRWK